MIDNFVLRATTKNKCLLWLKPNWNIPCTIYRYAKSVALSISSLKITAYQCPARNAELNKIGTKIFFHIGYSPYKPLNGKVRLPDRHATCKCCVYASIFFHTAYESAVIQWMCTSVKYRWQNILEKHDYILRLRVAYIQFIKMQSLICRN